MTQLMPVKGFFAVNFDNAITSFDACRQGRGIVVDFADISSTCRDAYHIDTGENANGKQDIEQWAAERDGQPLVHGCGGERALGVFQLFSGIFTFHFDVTAQRNGGDQVFGASGFESDNLGAESDGEFFDRHPAFAGDQKMAHLVDENKGGQTDQKSRHFESERQESVERECGKFKHDK